VNDAGPRRRAVADRARERDRSAHPMPAASTPPSPDQPDPGATGSGLPRSGLPTVGWREWVGLPDLGIDHCKAKVDTGARTSCMHAEDIAVDAGNDHGWVTALLRPWQDNDHDPVRVRVPLVGTRRVRSSNGSVEDRPVIATTVVLGELAIVAQLTLTRRDDMRLRMLLGREALGDRVVVDAARSYVAGRPPARIRRRNTASTDQDPPCS
jgi:hypothetical protein